MEKALRTLPATAGKSGQEVGVAYQKLMGEIERIKPISTRMSKFAQLVEGLQQERRNLLAHLSDLRHQRLQALQKAADFVKAFLLGFDVSDGSCPALLLLLTR